VNIVNFKQIIEQEFETEKRIDFHLAGREAFCTVKKINFSVRGRIERLNQIGIDGTYNYNADGKLIQSRTTIQESWVDMQEKILDLLLGNGLDPVKHNLQAGAMSVRDWRELATYFPDEFQKILDAVKDFNGLSGKN